MDRIRIFGGEPLNGIIPISGAKNAALPTLVASLLTDQPLTVHNIPRLADVRRLLQLLGNHGVDYTILGRRSGQDIDSGLSITLQAKDIIDTCTPYEFVSKMRASFWVIAPLLARFGHARLSMPGGCAIGTRPVDQLLMVLSAMGASIEVDQGYVIVNAPRGLHGAFIPFSKPTVGGTHVALMAASLAQGVTVIENAAREPEIVDLALCLNKMGARIQGVGTSRIEIEGITSLGGAEHTIIPDRIEAGTYAMAVAMTGGDVLLRGACRAHLETVIEILTQTGVSVQTTQDSIRIVQNSFSLDPISQLTTEPFPGFPTDLQAQFMALMTRANGPSCIHETIFESRFMHVQELIRLGAKINLSGDVAHIEGNAKLVGAPVMATDLRASASLVIAGLMAMGETVIHRVYHLDRGFEALEKKLIKCGARIERLTE
jgi:UDP-N-acetylglucosamine 1-carboxyvinyltransferase